MTEKETKTFRKPGELLLKTTSVTVLSLWTVFFCYSLLVLLEFMMFLLASWF